MDPTTPSDGRPVTGLARISSLFGAVTSAMQPARMPLALLAALFIAALTPIVDLAGGVSFGERGFAGSPVSPSQEELLYQRARNEASRIATLEISQLERERSEARIEAEETSGLTPRLSLAALRSAVRDATRIRIEERAASNEGISEAEERDLRRRAAAAMEVIDAAEPRGVASVFLQGERNAAKQVLNGLVRIDPEMFLAGILGAIFTVPAAAIRASPLIFPLALFVLLAGLSFIAGALCRMAAVHAGRGGRVGAREAAWFARDRALNLLALPLLPTLVLVGLALVVLVFALLLRVPVLNLLSAILFIIPLAVSLLAALLGLLSIVSFPLMSAAVVVEDCDSGDAITRAVALVIARPLVWLLVLAVSVSVLIVGALVVNGTLGIASSGVAALLDTLGGATGRALASGEESQVAALFGADRLVAGAAGLWLRLFAYLAGAYLFSLACDLAARGYLLMRARIDGEHPSTISGFGIR